MKFKSEIPLTLSKTISLREGLTIKVSPIPIGLRREFDLIMRPPQAPVVVTQSSNGGRREDVKWNDPNYLDQAAEYDYLKGMHTLWRVIKDDTDIHFDSPPPTDLASMRKLADEIKGSGLNEGDVKVIIEAAISISGLTDEKIKEAKQDF